MVELTVCWTRNLTVHRLSQPSEETVDVGVSSVVNGNIGMTILCEIKIVKTLVWFMTTPSGSQTSDFSTSNILRIDSPGKLLQRVDQLTF